MDRGFRGRGGQRRQGGDGGYGRKDRISHEDRQNPGKKGSASDLEALLVRIDHKSYPAYKDLQGQYDFGTYILSIDHVQGDPFAAPSSVSIHIKGEKAAFPETYRREYFARRALQDYLIRRFGSELEKHSHKAGGSGKSGLLFCSRPGQEVLDRSACQICGEKGDLVFRLYVGFPAAGRTVLADELRKILFHYLADSVRRSLYYSALDPDRVRAAIELAEDQRFLRKRMREEGLIAFVADGAILPRESGISQRPMRGAIPFVSPEEDRVTIRLPHRGLISGMAIREGVSLIIGGGYHGKSTLLQALEMGVYDHIEGDGRELVLCDETAVKVRAEDGRCILGDDISLFINHLPNGKNTEVFFTEDASGSTSQAAAVVEALESGTRALLMDEDTCATNFMVRDELMQHIVSDEEEPITPYSRRMRLLLEEGVSTILVAGSSGAFFEMADTIIQMDEYRPRNVTDRVREILRERRISLPDDKDRESRSSGARPAERFLLAGGDFDGKRGAAKVKSLGRDGFMIGHSTVDLRGVSQITDGEQTECLAQLLVAMREKFDGKSGLADVIENSYRQLEERGFGAAGPVGISGNMAMPRKQEVYAAVNRCRILRLSKI